VAAAAYPREPGHALEDVKNKLVTLREKCKIPSELEKNIEQFRSDMRALVLAVDRFGAGATLPEPAKRANRSKLQDLEYAVDAFYDYVKGRRDRADHVHVIGRAEVARYVRDAIESTIEHFGTFSSAERWIQSE
jgi:hypothetical protein